MQKNNPVAERFQHWVFHEVLPSIRTTGQYTLAPPAVTEFDRKRQAIEETKVQLEHMRLLADLRGTGDDRLDVVINTRLVNMIGQSSSAVALIDAPELKPLSQHLEEHGYSWDDAAQLTSRVCRAVAKAYRAAHGGKNPPKVKAALKEGRVVKIMQYLDEDWPLIQRVVNAYLAVHPVLDW